MKFTISLILSFVLVRSPAVSQVPDRHIQDTIRLARHEYVQYPTDNGASCICAVRNPDHGNRATVVITGAPDSLTFNDHTFFNGIHVLEPNEQIISAGNFKGKRVTLINLTVKRVFVVVLLFCPG